MTLVRFPPRRAVAIFVCEERDGDGWLAIAGAHGWLFGSLWKQGAQRTGSPAISACRFGSSSHE
jgi:hypothetical protein